MNIRTLKAIAEMKLFQDELSSVIVELKRMIAARAFADVEKSNSRSKEISDIERSHGWPMRIEKNFNLEGLCFVVQLAIENEVGMDSEATSENCYFTMEPRYITPGLGLHNGRFELAVWKALNQLINIHKYDYLRVPKFQ